MLEITEEQKKEILTYLARRPYVEVAALIGMIASLKKKEENKNDGVTSKK